MVQRSKLLVWLVGVLFLVSLGLQISGILAHDEKLKLVGLWLLLPCMIVMFLWSPHWSYDPARRMEIQLRVPGLSDDRSTWPTNECDLVLESVGNKPIHVIKALRETYYLDLRGARDIVDGAPIVLKQGISLAEAEFVKSRLEALGAKIEIKQNGDKT